MEIEVDLDDELPERAREYTGIDDPSELVTRGLRILIEREASRRLAALGSSDTEAQLPPRRRPEA